MDEQHESIKNKLKKLLALAERGMQGENQVKFYRFDIGRNAIYKGLFTQCFCKVAQKGSLSYRQISRSQIEVEMTALQYAEIVSLFEWHKDNFNKDLEDIKQNILLAYCRKHHLYSDEVKPDNDRELTADERKRLLKILFMQESLNDNQYHKLLDNN